ncbi:MAG: hypothetical protein U9R25_06050 [Chloroflexota bacterium]|nr:hypothetical protein [Chloroflexota bacterium]
MARKETPDLLGELLAGTAAETSTQPATQAATTPEKKGRKKTQKKPSSQRKTTPVTVWQHLLISFCDSQGWRPRYINGREIKGWTQAPLVHDYMEQLGEDGWELVGAGNGKPLYGKTDYVQLFFKRPKTA